MGFASVRQTLVSWVQGGINDGTLSAIASVTGAPGAIEPESVMATAQDALGATCIVWLGEALSQLYAPPAAWATQFTASFILVVLETSGDVATAQSVMDDAADQLRTFIREHRNAGNPSVVFSQGVGPIQQGGGPDLKVTMDFPTFGEASTAVSLWASIDVTVTELASITPS